MTAPTLTLENLAAHLVQQSFKAEVPEAAMPSLIEFMQTVAEEAAQVSDSCGHALVGAEIRKYFAIKKEPCALLKKPKKQMELDLIVVAR